MTTWLDKWESWAPYLWPVLLVWAIFWWSSDIITGDWLFALLWTIFVVFYGWMTYKNWDKYSIFKRSQP